MPISKAKTFLGVTIAVTIAVCQTFLFSPTLIATLKIGFIIVFKLVATKKARRC
jgi:urea transporter